MLTPCPRCWSSKVEPTAEAGARVYEPCRRCGGLGGVPLVNASEHFTVAECWGRQHRRPDGTSIPNDPPPDAVDRFARHLRECIEPLRAKSGALRVTSGYRSQELDALAAGDNAWLHKFSGHSWGTATDLQPMTAGLSLKDLMDMAIGDGAPLYDQAILEGGCLHLSAAAPRAGWLQRGMAMVRVRGPAGFKYEPYDGTPEQIARVA